ncbi:MAG: SMP-30/gluconolactonase/LRE family protein [Flavobacteriaceae bacterium]
MFRPIHPFIYFFVWTSILGQQNLGSIERIVPEEMNKLIPENSKIEVLSSGFQWAEGPLWVPKLKGVLFSDVPQNKVYLWTEKNGLSLFLDPSGMTDYAPHSTSEGANGLALDTSGNLILCQHGDRRVARLKKHLFNTVKYETLIDRFGKLRFNSPNDLTISSKGVVLFTDPPYGLSNQDQDSIKEIPFNGIYSWSEESGVQLLSKSLLRPNGIALSKDEKTVYIGNSDAKNAIVAAFDLRDGKLLRERVFFDGNVLVQNRRGLFDGLKVHSSGVVFATGPGGVLLISPSGKHLGSILTGNKATANCAFDTNEDYLYITSTDVLARIKLKQ